MSYVTIIAVVAGEDIQTGLILHWKLNETSGVAIDYSGNGYDGTVIGATQTTTGVETDGVNDEIVNTNAAFNSAMAGSTSWTGYIRASAPAFTALDGAFSIGESGADDALAIYPYSSILGDGADVWYDGEYSQQDLGEAPADNTFHDFAVVQSAADAIRFDIDGVTEATSTATKALAAAMDGSTLGRYIGNGEWFLGKISGHRIYTRPLTIEQMKHLRQLK